MKKINLGLCGLGRMGKAIKALVQSGREAFLVSPGLRVEFCIQAERGRHTQHGLPELCDVWIDFSSPDGARNLLLETKAPCVSGTTGFRPAQWDEWLNLGSDRALSHASNFSIGIQSILKWFKQDAALLNTHFHPTLLEQHHALKKDAPSGTAKSLADALQMKARNPGEQQAETSLPRSASCENNAVSQSGETSAIWSIRAGDIYSSHRVFFSGQGETLEVVHTAYDPTVFARGALLCAAALVGLPAGFYSIDQLLHA